MAEDRSRRDKTTPDAPVVRARAALKDGNFALARSLASAILKDANAAEPAREEARSVLDATRIDIAPVVVGIVMFSVLAVLFGWVLTHGHT